MFTEEFAPPPGKPKVRDSKSLRGIFRQNYPLLRIVWVMLDVLIALLILFSLTYAALGEIPRPYRVFSVFIAVFMLGIYRWSGLYDRIRNRTVSREIELLFSNMLLLTGGLLLAGYLTGTLGLFEPNIIGTWVATTFFSQVAFHLSIRWTAHAARRHSFNICRALLIGGGRSLMQINHSLSGSPWLGITVEGYLDISDQAVDDNGSNVICEERIRERTGEENGHQLPKRLGGINDVSKVVQEYAIDVVYLAFPANQISILPSVVQDLLRLDIDVKWTPDLSIFDLVSHNVEEIDGRPVFSLTSSPLGTAQSAIKWLEDKVLSALILVLASPLLIGIAIAIKISSKGPVLFIQSRHGLDGQVIRVWKFRTMFTGSDSKIREQATVNDSRVTPVGKFLRRWSLDELPQFFNVLFGQMSIVGPRPHPLWLDDRYAKVLRGYMQRHRVKPGITGWAQVNGWRGETDSPEKMEMRLRHDLYYINQWSFWLDLKILLKTPYSVVDGKNAW